MVKAVVGAVTAVKNPRFSGHEKRVESRFTSILRGVGEFFVFFPKNPPFGG